MFRVSNLSIIINGRDSVNTAHRPSDRDVKTASGSNSMCTGLSETVLGPKMYLVRIAYFGKKNKLEQTIVSFFCAKFQNYEILS